MFANINTMRVDQISLLRSEMSSKESGCLTPSTFKNHGNMRCISSKTDHRTSPGTITASWRKKSSAPFLGGRRTRVSVGQKQHGFAYSVFYRARQFGDPLYLKFRKCFKRFSIVLGLRWASVQLTTRTSVLTPSGIKAGLRLYCPQHSFPYLYKPPQPTRIDQPMKYYFPRPLDCKTQYKKTRKQITQKFTTIIPDKTNLLEKWIHITFLHFCPTREEKTSQNQRICCPWNFIWFGWLTFT